MNEYAPASDEPVDAHVVDGLDRTPVDEVPAGEASADQADVVRDVADAVQETERVRTGVEGVDAVLRSVEDLEATPVDDHVAVFEQAHEQLRGALDGRG